MTGLAVTVLELSTLEVLVSERLIHDFDDLIALWEAASLWSSDEDYESFSWPLICPRGLLWTVTLYRDTTEIPLFFIELNAPVQAIWPNTFLAPIG